MGSALLLAAAFPPLNWWPLALFAPVPLLAAVWADSRKNLPVLLPAATNAAGGNPETKEKADSPGDYVGPDPVGTQAASGTVAAGFWRGFRLGWLFGFVFFTATLWWVQHVTLAGMLALTAYLALYPAAAMGVAGWLGMRRDERWGVALGKLLLVAGVWTGLEWVRSIALWGFPWNGLAVPLFELRSANSLVVFSGVGGLSFAVICFNGFVLLVLETFRRSKIAGVKMAAFGLTAWAGIEFVGCLNVGWYQREFTMGVPPLRAVLLQPNVTMEEKMSPDPEVQRQRYFDLVDQTETALTRQWPLPPRREDWDEDWEKLYPSFNPNVSPALVIWPESAVPGFFEEMVQGGAFTDQLKRGDSTLITGADHEEWGKLYNSVAAMRGNTDNRAIHPKIRLVPFGEFIPFRKEVPLFEKMLGNLIPLDFTPGTSLEPMRVKGQDFSIIPLVCFEDTIGDHARKFIRPEPQVIVNVTNDNWFHESPATEMHFVNARWRALELRRTLLRSANTGVTAIVSPWGELQRIPSHQRGELSGKFYAFPRFITFYAQHGDLFSHVTGALSLLGCGVVWWRRRRSAHQGAFPSKSAEGE